MDKGVIISLLVVILSLLAPIIRKAKQANNPQKPGPSPRPFGLDWDWVEEENPASQADAPSAEAFSVPASDIDSARRPDLASARTTDFVPDSSFDSDLREGIRVTNDTLDDSKPSKHNRPEGFDAKKAVLFSEILAPKFDEFG